MTWTSPEASKQVMNGATRPRVAMPPRQPPCSTSIVSTPSRAAAIAAHTPAGPPPTTSTFVLYEDLTVRPLHALPRPPASHEKTIGAAAPASAAIPDCFKNDLLSIGYQLVLRRIYK